MKKLLSIMLVMASPFSVFATMNPPGSMDSVDFNTAITADKGCGLNINLENTGIQATYTHMTEDEHGQLVFVASPPPIVTIDASGCPISGIIISGTQTGVNRVSSSLQGLNTHNGGMFVFAPGIADFRFYSDVGATTGMLYATNMSDGPNSTYSDVSGDTNSNYPASYLPSIWKNANPSGIPVSSSITGNMKGGNFNSGFGNRCFGINVDGVVALLSQNNTKWCDYAGYASSMTFVPTNPGHHTVEAGGAKSAKISFGVIASSSLYSVATGEEDSNAAFDGEVLTATSTVTITTL